MRSQFRSEDVARDGKPNPCTECEKFSNCKMLCPRVEAWVNQDHVGRKYKEVLLNNEPDMDHYTNEFVDYMHQNYAAEVTPNFQTAATAWETVKLMRLPKNSFDFARLYYREGKTLAEVAAALMISSQAANDRHKKLKKDVKDRLQRIEIWGKIKDNYDDDCTVYEMAEAMFFGAFWSPKEIADKLEIHYVTVLSRVNNIRSKFSLDKIPKDKD